jgi:hypothetical protein
LVAAKGPDGELVLGFSHEEGLTPEPFDKTMIDNWLISYVRNFLQAPNLGICERWHAIQAIHHEHHLFGPLPGGQRSNPGACWPSELSEPHPRFFPVPYGTMIAVCGNHQR